MVKKDGVEAVSVEVTRDLHKEDVGGEVTNDLKRLFLKALSHITTARLGEQLEVLEQKQRMGAGFGADDLKTLNRLQDIFRIRATRLEEQVARAIGLSEEGRVDDARRLAFDLIKEQVDELPAGKLDRKTVERLKTLAKTTIDTTNLHKNGGLDKKGELLVAKNQVESGRVLEREIQTKLKGTNESVDMRVAKLSEEMHKGVTRDLLAEMRKASKENTTEQAWDTRDIELDKLVPDTLILDDVAIIDLKRRLRDVPGGREVKDLLEGDSNIRKSNKAAVGNLMKNIVENPKAKGRGTLEDYGNNLKLGEDELERDRQKYALKGIDRSKLKKNRVELILGGMRVDVTLPKSASIETRLERVLEIIKPGQGSWSEDQRIDFVQQALGIEASDRDEAVKIWNQVSEWDKKYGKFRDGIGKLRAQIEDVLHPTVDRNQKAEPWEIMAGMGRGRYGRKEIGAMKRGVVREGVDDSETELNEHGKAVQELLGKDYELKVWAGKDTKNRDMFRAQTNEEFWSERNAAGQFPRGMTRSEELYRITAGRSYKDMGLEERDGASEQVKEAVKDMINRIQATGDSSRAPNNQPLSWEVNELLSWLDKRTDADFRDLMQARLASYDQSTILGSIAKKDQHEQIAMFMPREWLAILVKDKTEFGGYIGEDGKFVKYQLRAQYVAGELEDMAPGKSDREDIWFNELMKPESLEGVGLMRRRFVAYLIGKQRGVEFEFKPDGSFVLASNPENLKKATTWFGETKGNIFQEVGLTMDGNMMSDEEYENFEKYDVYKQSWAFVNQSITRKIIEGRAIALERGGWYAQNINAFRKIWGWGMLDYTAQKLMGMNSSRGDLRDGQVVGGVDNKWRSLPAWKLMAKQDVTGDYVFIDPLMKGFAKSFTTPDGEIIPPNSDQNNAFVKMFEHIAYMPERWYIGKLIGQDGYGGELKPMADVRHMTGDEFNEIAGYFGKISGSESMDWSHILKQMQVPEAVLSGNVNGVEGLKIFCQYYNLEELMDYSRMPQNFYADFVSYTGYSAKTWDIVPKLVINMADPNLQKEFIDGIRGYDDGLANATLTELQAKTINEVMPDLNGYSAWVGSDGKENSKKWRINTSGANYAQEKAHAEKHGLRVRSDGQVVDKNGRFVPRPDNVPYLQNIIERKPDGGWGVDLRGLINKVWAQGSPYIRRGRKPPSWEDLREFTFQSLREMKVTDENVWRDVHARFNALMYFGVEVGPHEDPSMKTIIAKLRKEPWKLAALPWTILRGLYTDAPIDLASLIAAWQPLGKQVNRIFSD